MGMAEGPLSPCDPGDGPTSASPGFLQSACSFKLPSLALWPLSCCPFHLSFLSNYGLPVLLLFPSSLPGGARPQQGSSSILSFPALTWAGPPAMLLFPASSVAAEKAATDDSQEPMSVHPSPGLCLQLHLLAPLLFSDSPTCPRRMVLQNLITAGSRKSLKLPSTEIVLLFPTSHWGPF